jgi:hypothetical protein
MKYAILLCAFLCGCVAPTVKNSSRPRIAPKSADEAVIYLIRDSDKPTSTQATVVLNGKRLITFSDNGALSSQVPQYTWFSVEPGKYRVVIYPLDYDWRGEPAADSTLDIEKGQAQFIEIAWHPKPEPSFLEGLAQPLIEPIVGRKRYLPPEIITMPESEAMDVMAHARFVDAVE